MSVTLFLCHLLSGRCYYTNSRGTIIDNTQRAAGVSMRRGRPAPIKRQKVHGWKPGSEGVGLSLWGTVQMDGWAGLVRSSNNQYDFEISGMARNAFMLVVLRGLSTRLLARDRACSKNSRPVLAQRSALQRTYQAEKRQPARLPLYI